MTKKTIPHRDFRCIFETVVNMPSILLAPVAVGQPVAELAVTLNGTSLINEPLRALQDNPSGSFWQRSRDTVQLWLE